MNFNIYLPYSSYEQSNVDLSNYYKNPQDYMNALQHEDDMYSMAINSAMAGGMMNHNNAYYNGGNYSNNQQHNVDNGNIAYGKAVCTLYSPNGAMPETVDSMIDKFAAQKEFLVMVNLLESQMDTEFYEEFKQWQVETKNILDLGKTKGVDFVEQFIPRRTMRISFLNKSNKEVRFTFEDTEIEERVSKTRYILYVKRMQILK
jgi:hypothetical protein